MTEPAVHCAHDDLVHPDALKPHPRNPNEHPMSQVRLIAKIIGDTGWRNPITVSKRSGYITRGHGRLLAALHAGFEFVPVDEQDYTSDAEELADLVADNKLAELSTLSADAVSSILQELDQADQALAGYTRDEVDLLLCQIDVKSHVREAREVGVPKTRPAKLQTKYGTELGQMWASDDNEHRLIIDDATDAGCYPLGLQADMVFTDPPYGVAYEGKTADALTIKNDDLDEASLERLLTQAFDIALQSLKPGGAVYCFAPPGPLLATFMRVLILRNVLRQVIMWAKDRFVLGRSDYHYRHEPILYGWKPDGPHYYAPGDRTQDSVWEYPRPAQSADHPNMKPVELAGRAIVNNTRPMETILDPFAGSGSTAIAAAQLERRSVSIEVDPAYAAVIIERLASVGVNLTLVE